MPRPRHRDERISRDLRTGRLSDLERNWGPTGCGSLAIRNRARVGQTVQFHVRDAVTDDEDLVRLLEHDRTTNLNPPRGALLFSSNGRGTRLFPEPNHDAGTIQDKIGPIPLAGFFAQGELGPVGGKTYVHGFTAIVALFE